MKKKILAAILCVLMILPCFTWIAGAEDLAIVPDGVEITNIAPNGKTYHSSVWNADGSARFLNNGVLYSSWQFWRPGSVERPDTPGIDDTLQYAGMKFNNYYTFNEVTVYAHKYGTYDGAFCGKCGYENREDGYLQNSEIYDVHKKENGFIVYQNSSGTKFWYDEGSGKFYKDNRGREEAPAGNYSPVVDYRRCKSCDTKVLKFSNDRNNIKITVNVLVQGQWIEAGHAYNNDMEYVVQGEEKEYQVLGEDLASITIKLDKVLPAYNEEGDIIVDDNGTPIYTDYATTKNVRIDFTEYGAYALRGTTSEIGLVYSGDEVTHVNYKGVKYSVTKDEEASIPTYNTTYTYTEDGKQFQAPLIFTVSEKFGGAEFPIIQAETFIDTGKLDDNNDPIYHSSNRDRYLFNVEKYRETGKVEITQKLASTHDWWLVPLIQEVEINGFQTINKPKFDVPEGAEVVSDAALGGMAGATTSAISQHPLLGNDRQSTTQWQAADYEGQSFWVDFDMEYRIKEVKFDFGSMPQGYAGSKYVFNIYVKKSGQWTLLYENQTANAVSDLLTDEERTKFDVDEVIGGVKIEFTSSTLDGEPVEPRITEVSAPISDGKQCVFLSSYLDFFRASSTAQGNLACYGEAYCSSSFDYSNVSDVNFLIDGQVTDDAFSWFANDFTKGTYCGVKLKETEEVTKIVLYFNDAITGGKYDNSVMLFDVEALVDGQYVKVAEGASYDTDTKKPIVAVEFPAVKTNDIRIVFKSSAMMFPYCKEFEVYSGEKVYSAYDGYLLDTSTRTLHGRYPTANFGQRTVIARAPYMNLMVPYAYLIPIEQLVYAMSHGIDLTK